MLRYPVVHLRRAILKKTNEEEKLSQRHLEEEVVGGFVKNYRPKSKGRFSDEEKSGQQPRYRKPEALPPAKNHEEGEKIMTGTPATPVTPRPQLQQDCNTEPCPICGGPKYKEATFLEDGQKKTVKILVCAACTAKYKAYQEGVRATNIKTIVANPTVPEPAGPVDKFHWVLGQLDLEKFKAEAKAAETAYRIKYDEVVVKVLAGRGYLVGTPPEWKGIGTSRPVMRFTSAAFAGIGPNLRTALEEQVKDLRWAMKKTTGRLEAATRVKTELEAELAKNAPPALPPAPPADAAPATPAAEKKTADNGSTPPPVDVKPSAKPRKFP